MSRGGLLITNYGHATSIGARCYRQMSDERWTFWQFANRGHLEGVTTFVGLNVFNGMVGEFQKLRCG